MNYLTEIKLFYDWLETHELTPSAILLWHGLMFIANRAGWDTEMTVPMRRLEGVTYMTEASIYRARKALVNAGILTVEERGSNRASIYTLLSFEDGSALRTASRSALQYERHSESQSERQSETHEGENGASAYHSAPHSERQSESIYKLNETCLSKEKQTKKKTTRSKSFSMDEWVSVLESPWRELMRIWLEYKKARKEGYTSEMGAKACLTKLKNLSGNNPQTAQAIIENSMANNWAGLFPVSGQSARGHPAAPATGQRIGQILQPQTEEHRQSILEKFRSGIKSGDTIPKQ